MEDYIRLLNEYFCSQYADYNKITAIVGYRMPEIVYVGADGNICRHSSELMRLCHQENCDELLQRFKNNMEDTEFTFNFRFRKRKERRRDLFRKDTFAKLLPAALGRVRETTDSVGEKLDISPKIWKRIVKGKLYPEKNTLIALALVTGMGKGDVNDLLHACGFSFSRENVRDVVTEYLIMQGVFNREMRNRCLKEYKITTLPIKEGV